MIVGEIEAINQPERKVVTVEVSSEEAFWQYPQNPDYKYIFIITTPSRGICYMCGQNYMTLKTRIEEYSSVGKTCPNPGWDALDMFITYSIMSWEQCSYCGYKSSEWFSSYTYAAMCRNGDTPSNGGLWQIKPNWDNMHENLNWWKYYQI